MREREPDREGQKGRIDPVLRWDEVEFRAEGREPPDDPPPQWRERRRIWPWALLALVALAVALALFREPLAEALWPDTRVQRLLDDAETALKRGHLTAEDGSGARERFEAVQALDSDRIEARTGLVRVGYAALQQAQAATRDNRLEEARKYLDLARELQVPRANINLATEQLRTKEKESQTGGVDALLQQAQNAQTAAKPGGSDPTAALPLYQRVLALQPNNITALEGREDTLADLLQRARGALANDDLVRAGALVARVQAVDPGHFDLPEARAALASATARRLQQADRELERGQLSSAVVGYRAVQQVDPDNLPAARGLVAVAGIHAAASERHAADFSFVQARAALLEAQEIAPDIPAVTAARAYLAHARQSHARLDSAEPADQRKQRLATLLAEASAAEARGDMLDPPGDSAYDKLRAAQAIAPRDEGVRAAIRKLAPSAQACFQRNLRSNALSKAGACLDAWIALGADGAPVNDARRRLAARWIAYANERLGAYELGAADAALSNARQLDPAAPGLEDLAARLVVAGGG